MTAPVTALVPMRHDSERVPMKNYRECGGMPLYRHIVRALMQCPHIENIVIDTDSPIISEDVSVNFPDITLIDRPMHLRGGRVSMNEVLTHDVKFTTGDIFLQTHSTNPLLRSSTITRAIEEFDVSRGSRDGLFSVTRLQARLWDRYVRPVNHELGVLERTQDLEPLYLENSCLYIFPRETLDRFGSRIGERPMMFELDPEEAWDIDEEFDFQVVDLLLKRFQSS